MKKLVTFIVITLFLITGCGQENNASNEKSEVSHATTDSHADKSTHNESENENPEHNNSGIVKLTPTQMKMADIKVETLNLKNIAISIDAPGEVKLNAYKTIKVTPRIAAQVIARHAVLGDLVKVGQALVTLSSVEMADAQGQLLLADKEWKRVVRLGKKVVSQRRFITAKVNYEKSLASVKAYGMTKSEISALLAGKRLADGSFKLIANQAGRVLHDVFTVGQRVEAGYELMVIADESTMWVEARVTPANASKVKVGNDTEISFNGKTIPAKVIQLHHSLDETTRTSAVRIEVNNKDDLLHSGMFVSVKINTTDTRKGFSLPEAAVLRSPDGDWQIFVEQDEAGKFKAIEIKVDQVHNGQAIISGIKAGVRVVTQGAFSVQSELAKSGFSVHNH